jgi:sialic acid synthase SpsE
LFGAGPGKESHSEKDMHEVARRSIAAAVDLPIGTIVEKEHLTWVRPGTGMAPGEESILVGKRVVTEKLSGEIFAPKDVI